MSSMSEPFGVESSFMAIDRERRAQQFARKNHGRLSGGQAACAIALVKRTPHLGFAGRASPIKQQASQLGRATFRQSSPSLELTRVFGTRIESDKRHRGIAIVQRYPLKRIGQRNPEQWADPQDAFHAPLGLGLMRGQLPQAL